MNLTADQDSLTAFVPLCGASTTLSGSGNCTLQWRALDTYLTDPDSLPPFGALCASLQPKSEVGVQPCA